MKAWIVTDDPEETGWMVVWAATRSQARLSGSYEMSGDYLAMRALRAPEGDDQEGDDEERILQQVFDRKGWGKVQEV